MSRIFLVSEQISLFGYGRDNVVGWVTISHQGNQILVEPGFKKELRFDGTFEREYEAEVDRFAVFLQKR